MALSIERYSGNEKEWDDFILNKSMNGTFIQTRRFINYHHEGKFNDHSLCIRKGNELVAALLACELSGRVFVAHQGTTFGGLSISKNIYNSSSVDELFALLNEYFEKNFSAVRIKMVPEIYQKRNCDLLDYFFYKTGYTSISELNFYMPLDKYAESVLSPLSSNKRRDYKYSLNNQLVFCELTEKEQISEYYDVLLMNLKKLNLNPVHTLEELLDLKFNRYPDKIRFYGVYYDERIIAGSMVFLLTDSVFHTQYLSSDQNYLNLFPMDFLIVELIKKAVEGNNRVFSFGICTEEQGKYLNLGLSRFKEGFGSEYCINKTFEKRFTEGKNEE
jgi:hypothetical protein